jgi:hypothetical protein
VLLNARAWHYLCVVVRDLAEQVVGHVRVSDAVEEDVQDAVAAQHRQEQHGKRHGSVS